MKSIEIQSFFWSIFSRIRTKCVEIRSIFSYSTRIRENTDQKKTLYLDTFHALLSKLIIVHLSINFLRNNFDLLVDTIKGNFDIIIISETKLDSTFKIGKFLLDGFNGSIRLDRNRNGGGILLLTREDIPQKFYLLKLHQSNDFLLR